VHRVAGCRPVLVIDLIGVDFLDAVGIGVLLAGVVVCRAGVVISPCVAPNPKCSRSCASWVADEILPAPDDRCGRSRTAGCWESGTR